MTTPHRVSPRSQARWNAAAYEHEVALAAYLRSASALPHASWTRAWGEGKWTPAQVTEHVTRAYEALLDELREGRPMREKLAGWRKKMVRIVLLPHILFHRKIPLRVPSPREMRPGDPRADREGALQALRELGECFTAELSAAREQGSPGLTHPYFGKLEPIKVLRFVAIHLDHHRKQIERTPA